jgi:uncharacterized protein (TIGR03083 family)
MRRLSYRRYLDLLGADAELLATTAARDLDAPVPPCPGWDVRETVRHTGSVYHHKVACLELRREPADGEWSKRPSKAAALIPWFRDALAALTAVLSSRSDRDPAYTWWPPEQTAGFWARRMALETVVHRVDVESAFGRISPVARDLAVDGIDEVLRIMLVAGEVEAGGDVGAGAEEPLGSVAVQTDGCAWMVQLRAGTAVVDTGTRFATDASLGGDPGALLLYLWGRAPLESIDADGDAALVDSLRRRLARATQ